MARFRVVTAVVAAALALAGCATYTEIPFDHQTAGPIKSIGLLTPQFPTEPTVVLASTVGQSFGLIGAMIDSGMMAKRDAAFQTLLRQQNFSALDTFDNVLKAALAADGYNVSMVPITRTEPGHVKTYPTNIEPKVDAYLDIVVSEYGYLAAGIGKSTPYRPSVWLSAKLVRASDAAVLMRAVVVYNYIGPSEHFITIAPDPAYVFVDFDTLMADSAQSVKGVQEAIRQTAGTVATLLK